MTTTGGLPIHRPRCAGDPGSVSSRRSSVTRVVIRTCQECGAVALERIPENRKDTA